MKGLVLWCAKNPFLAILASVLLMVCGIAAARTLPIDAVPDVTNVQVQVVTRAPALSATEVESQITQPIERAMAGAPGLVSSRSISKLGISIITLIFRDDIDTYFARAQVNERIMSVRDQIPAELGRPELGPVTTGLGEIYMFELRGDGKRSNEELRTMIEWQLGPRLRQVPGVVEVVGFGGNVKQYRVTVDPPRLAAHGVSIQEIREALQRDNRIAGGGYIEQAGEQLVLRGDARFRGIEDIAETIVRTDANGVPVRVGQLGSVDTGSALRQGAMTRDGRGEIVGASVYMLKGQNSREVVDRVKTTLDEMKPFLPTGVSVESYYDRSDFINSVIGTIAKNLTEGALVVIVCLLLTLGSMRAGLLVAGAIPFAMLFGFMGLSLVGYSGNVMSLGAIDFGIVVEGTVVAIEHAVTHGASIQDRKKRARAIANAMAEVARPAVFGVIITVLVFVPLVTLEDVEGKMFRPVVVSLCFMLLGALVYALVLIPAIAPRFLKGSPKEPWLIRQTRRAYVPSVDFALRRPWLTLCASFAVTAILFVAGSGIGAEFLPRIFEGSLAIDALRPPSTSLTQAVALANETELALKESPEVLTVVNRIGRPEGAVDPAGPESSDVFVILKPKKEWRKGMTAEALTEELSNRVDARVPATINAFSQPIEMRVNDLIAGAKSDVVIKLFGEDLATLADLAESIKRIIMQVPGASDVKAEVATGLPSVRIMANRDRMSRLGISPGVALDTLTAARVGLEVGTVREGERVFDLVLRVGGDEVRNQQDLGRLPIATSKGNLVPLSTVADITQEKAVVQVGREQMRRRLLVQVNVRGRDMVGFVKEAQSKVAKLEVPKSVEVVWGGQFQNFNRATSRLSLLVPVSFGVIALMLVVTYRSTRYTLVTLLNIPFAVAGGLISLVLRGLPFSIPAAVGFIALCGVSVMTGIVMTSNLLAIPWEPDAAARVRKAAAQSLRAPLSTALVAAVGFIPAALATGTGAEVQRPLATVVIGGLVFSLAISLIALPAMLLFVAKREKEPVKEEEEGEDDAHAHDAEHAHAE